MNEDVYNLQPLSSQQMALIDPDELATLKKFKEAWEIYFQAEEEKNKHQGRRSWLWIGFFKTAEDMARAALAKGR